MPKKIPKRDRPHREIRDGSYLGKVCQTPRSTQSKSRPHWKKKKTYDTEDMHGETLHEAGSP